MKEFCLQHPWMTLAVVVYALFMLDTHLANYWRLRFQEKGESAEDSEDFKNPLA